MLARLAAAVATVSPTPSPSLSPAPSVDPVATYSPLPIAHAAGPHLVNLGAYLNTLASQVSSVDITALAGGVAVVLQNYLNRSPWLQHEVAEVQNFRRWTVAVAIPFVMMLVDSAATGHNTLGLTPLVFLAAQVVFRVWKRLTTPTAVAQPADGLPRTNNP